MTPKVLPPSTPRPQWFILVFLANFASLADYDLYDVQITKIATKLAMTAYVITTQQTVHTVPADGEHESNDHQLYKDSHPYLPKRILRQVRKECPVQHIAEV
jgi:hypothetical protein